MLYLRNQLCTLSWYFYSDVVFAGGGDLDTGIKRETGWKAFGDDVSAGGSLTLDDRSAPS